MKKVIILMVLVMSLMIAGCTQTEKIEKEEVVKSVYCDSCSEESKEVTKFCSNCGVEAKWVSEKPEIAEVTNYNDEENKIGNSKEKESVDKKDEVKVEKGQCGNCGAYFPKNQLNKFYEGLLCTTCYNLPKNCENGFVGLCEGCSECEPTSQYNPSDYDLYYPEGDLDSMYTCTNCGRTSNMYMGTIGMCEKCLE